MDTRHNKVLQSIMWDYNISVEEIGRVIDGKTARAGHYNLEGLFVKMASGLPMISYWEETIPFHRGLFRFPLKTQNRYLLLLNV